MNAPITSKVRYKPAYFPSFMSVVRGVKRMRNLYGNLTDSQTYTKACEIVV